MLLEVTLIRVRYLVDGGLFYLAGLASDKNDQ